MIVGKEESKTAAEKEAAVEEKKAATPVNCNSEAFSSAVVDMNLTHSNFHEVADQSNKLNALATNLPEPNNKERIMDRLLKSVNMVKEVLQSNLKLREQVQELGQRLELQSAELFHLHSENEEQKEKLQLISNLQEHPSEKQRFNAAERILQLEKDKARLAKRVHDLEVQNTQFHTAMPGTDDFEPVRAVVNEGFKLLPIKEATQPNTKYKDSQHSTKYGNRARNSGSSRLWMYNTTIDSFISNGTGYKTCKRGASTAQRASAMKSYMKTMEKLRLPRQVPLSTTEAVNKSQDKLLKDAEEREYITSNKGAKKKRHKNANQLFFDII